jgi:hypothetical protein
MRFSHAHGFRRARRIDTNRFDFDGDDVDVIELKVGFRFWEKR